MPELVDRRLLGLLGGEAGCKRLALEFYARVAINEDLRPLFPGKSLRCATEEFAAFLIQFLDGDPDQTQYRWWLSLRESHSRFKITGRQRGAWLGLMNETLHSLIEDSQMRRALEEFFLSSSAYIIGVDDCEIDHQELRQRWLQQKTLDQLVDDIAHGRDAEAVKLAQQYTSRRSLFVGILARMMDASREPLIEFILESVRNDDDLVESRFNGRTLLHVAAGSSCLPVVRQLLTVGVDPDILDSGGHTPLYRVAGSSKGDQGPMIVRELARAGATVDHCGGVSKSTPLHEAARHGNLHVAEALLEAGASPTSKDKKGLTPLDRAKNCRKHGVAALLASRC